MLAECLMGLTSMVAFGTGCGEQAAGQLAPMRRSCRGCAIQPTPPPLLQVQQATGVLIPRRPEEAALLVTGSWLLLWVFASLGPARWC